MENIIEFEPFFGTTESVLFLPREAVQQVRAAALEVFLNETEGDMDTIRDVAERTMVVTRLLLSKAHPHRGPIIRVLTSAGYKLCGDPVLLVVSMISQWFYETSPYFTRSINSEIASETPLGNLGYLSILLTTESFKEVPQSGNPKFRRAVLIANSVTTIVCGAFVIFRGFGPDVEESWDRSVKLAPPSVCIWAYLKSSWQVARTGGQVWDNGGPEAQFSATPEEIRMRRDGKRLLVNIGRLKWEDPAYWHPCKQVPGSPWNKFLRNKNQPTFEPSHKTTSTQIMHRLPNTAIKFAEIFEDFYDAMIEGMSKRGFARVTLDDEELDLQHNQLASGSGLWYPDTELDEEDATEIYTPFQDYLDVVPLAKRPTTDACGHLTIGFMASVVRALRFNREPEPIEEDLWVMTMGGVEGGDVLQ